MLTVELSWANPAKLFDPLHASQRKTAGLRASLRAITTLNPDAVITTGAPSVAWQSGAVSTISGAVTVAMTDARISYGGNVGLAGNTAPLNAYFKSVNPPPEGTDNGGGMMNIKFGYYGAKFEAIFRGRASTGLRLRVDGLLVAVDFATIGSTPDTNGTDDLLIVTFTAAGRHEIELECNPYLYFKGLNIGPTDSIYPSVKHVPATWLFIGDSITRGPLGVVDHARTYHQQLARAFGWTVIGSGVGGTGYSATNTGGNSNLLQRLSRDCLSIISSLDGICVAMGVNDRQTSGGFGTFNGQTYGYADVGPNAASVYAQIRAAAPDLPLIVLSRFTFQMTSPVVVQFVIRSNRSRSLLVHHSLICKIQLMVLGRGLLARDTLVHLPVVVTVTYSSHLQFHIRINRVMITSQRASYTSS